MSLPNLKQSKSTDLRNEFLTLWISKVISVDLLDGNLSQGTLKDFDTDSLLIIDADSVHVVPWAAVARVSLRRTG